MLTLYEDAHVSAAEVNVVGNLTPVDARVIAMKGTQKKQSAVSRFHTLWHFIVQSTMQKEGRALEM